MAYFPANMPLPDCDPWETKFWEYCDARELRFQSCSDCGEVRHPPVPVCPNCQSQYEEWVPASDDAELYTFTIIHHVNHPALEGRVPYNASVVMFPSLGNVRLVTNVIDAAPETLRIGMQLTLIWESPTEGRWLPRFKSREDNEAAR